VFAIAQAINVILNWKSVVPEYSTARMENKRRPAQIAKIRPAIETGTRIRASTAMGIVRHHPISRRSRGTMAPNRSAMPTMCVALTLA
jgi:hypothetical protein